MMKQSWRLALLAAACTSAWAGCAAAQSVSSGIQSADARSDIFARERGVTVRERPRPEYEALGLPAGAFTFFPRAQLDVEYNDNVFATNTDTDSDTIARLRPDLSLRSNWSRHMLNLYARANTAKYADLTTEETTDYTVGGSGRVDIGVSSNLNAGASTGRYTEPRTSNSTPEQARSPVRFDQDEAYLAGAVVFNRVKLSGRADYRKFNYDDATSLSGANLEQDDRDRTVTSLTGRADYALSPATSIFLQATANERDYKTIAPGIPTRDSTGNEILIGSSFELSTLIRAEVAVGHVEQDFDDDAFKNISGFGAHAEVTWMPTELTTVTFTGGRTIEDAGISDSAGYLSTQVGVQVDHELLRNLILTGILSYGQDDFEDLSRTDDRWGASVSGTYLISRNLSVAATLSRSSRNSDGGVGQDYDQNRFIVSIVTQF